MESQVFFRRPGYEYRYRIGMDDEIISLYKELYRSCYDRSFILEVRTNFILKKTTSDDEGEEIIGSERFATVNPVDLSVLNLPMDELYTYTISIDFRLEEYWLPEDEIEPIAREAMSFVKRTAADPRHDSLDLIPVVVYMDVCTVQLQGELLDATVCRSIKPDRLIPIQLCSMNIVQPADWRRPRKAFMMEEIMAMSHKYQSYLLSLPGEREEDVGVALARMESCPICLQAPVYGTRISHPLPNCDHVFHGHCIVRWLMKNKTCPVCHSKITLDKWSSLADEQQNMSCVPF